VDGRRLVMPGGGRHTGVRLRPRYGRSMRSNGSRLFFASGRASQQLFQVSSPFANFVSYDRTENAGYYRRDHNRRTNKVKIVITALAVVGVSQPPARFGFYVWTAARWALVCGHLSISPWGTTLTGRGFLGNSPATT
jgi:hypothetical protein